MNVMDNEDTNKSIPSQSKTRLKGERMPQRCRRCRNHNLIINLSGHKRYCKYRNCCCDQCVRTLTTQKWSAKKTYRNRALKQDKEKQDKEKQDKDKEKQDKEKQDKEKQDKEKQRKVSMNPDEPDEQVAPLPYEDALKAAEREREEIHEIRIMIQPGACCYFPVPPNVMGAPTYEGHVPYIGIGTPPNPFHFWPITWPFNSLAAAAAISTPPYPDSPPESSSTYHWPIK